MIKGVQQIVFHRIFDKPSRKFLSFSYQTIDICIKQARCIIQNILGFWSITHEMALKLLNLYSTIPNIKTAGFT